MSEFDKEEASSGSTREQTSGYQWWGSGREGQYMGGGGEIQTIRGKIGPRIYCTAQVI